MWFHLFAAKADLHELSIYHPQLLHSGLKEDQVWAGSWSVLAFFGGRSPAELWHSMRGTVRKLQIQKQRFRNPRSS